MWPEEGRFWCRSCEKRGDAIQYLRDKRGLTYPEACSALGIEPSRNGHDQPKSHAAGRAGVTVASLSADKGLPVEGPNLSGRSMICQGARSASHTKTKPAALSTRSAGRP